MPTKAMLHVRLTMTAATLLLLLVPTFATAQGGGLAGRVAAVRDGEVRFSYPTRSGACGDGKKFIGFGRTMQIHPDIDGYGRWSGVNCVPGAARIAVTMRGGEAVALRPYVGGTWEPSSSARDLGTVSAVEAVEYLVGTAARGEVAVAKAALLPAAIADAPGVAARLLAIGRDTERSTKVRRRAVQLSGATGDATTVPALLAIATGGEWDGKKSSDDGVASAAIAALAGVPDGAGMDALIGLVRDDDVRVRKQAVFWLGMSEDARGRRAARAVAENAAEDTDVRGNAIFAIGQGEAATIEDRAWLRALYPRLTSESLRDRVLMAAGQSGGEADHRWLLERAADDGETTNSRRQAIFWAGQGGVPIANLLALYRRLDNREVKEHIIFALSQREETAATDALLAMARADGDRELRKKALFWLTQKRDPRVTKLISDLVSQ